MPEPEEILLGKIALGRNLIRPDDLRQCIALQERERSDTPLGRLLVEQGLIDERQLEEIVQAQQAVLQKRDTTGQKKEDIIFGKLVVKRRLASPDQVNQALREQQKLREQGVRRNLGEVMVDLGFLKEPQVQSVLNKQSVAVLHCPHCGKNFNVKNYDPLRNYKCGDCHGVLVPAESREAGIRASGTVSESATPAAERPTPTAFRRRTPVTMAVRLQPRDGGTAVETDFEVEPPGEMVDEMCGREIGGYRILKKLGAGGMGRIYKAEQLSLGRLVALKMLRKELAKDGAYLDRFFKEARAVARFNHPNIVQIYDVAASDGYYYFSMEYVEGENVGDILDRIQRPMSVNRVRDIIKQVTRALVEAHSHSIVHRDIKPDNIMLARSGVAKLADLGIAKQSEAGKEGSHDSPVSMGTPFYVSPEQARDPASVDIRADVFSLGATFFHMATGKVPFYGENPFVVIMKVANEPHPDPREFNHHLTLHDKEIIDRMMAKSPADRFASPQELLDVLDALDVRGASGRGDSQRLWALTAREVVKIDATVTGPRLELDESEEPPPHLVIPDYSEPQLVDAVVGNKKRSTVRRPAAAVVAAEEGAPAGGAEERLGLGDPLPGRRVSSRRPAASRSIPTSLVIVLLLGLLGGGYFLLAGGKKDAGDASKKTWTLKSPQQRHKERGAKDWAEVSARIGDPGSVAPIDEALATLRAFHGKYSALPEGNAALERIKELEERRIYLAGLAGAELHVGRREWAQALALLGKVRVNRDALKSGIVLRSGEIEKMAARHLESFLAAARTRTAGQDWKGAFHELEKASRNQTRAGLLAIAEARRKVLAEKTGWLARLEQQRRERLQRGALYLEFARSAMAAADPRRIEEVLKRHLGDPRFAPIRARLGEESRDAVAIGEAVTALSAALKELGAAVTRKKPLVLEYLRRHGKRWETVAEKTWMLRPDPRREKLFTATTIVRYRDLTAACLTSLLAGGTRARHLPFLLIRHGHLEEAEARLRAPIVGLDGPRVEHLREKLAAALLVRAESLLAARKPTGEEKRKARQLLRTLLNGHAGRPVVDSRIAWIREMLRRK